MASALSSDHAAMSHFGMPKTCRIEIDLTRRWHFLAEGIFETHIVHLADHAKDYEYLWGNLARKLRRNSAFLLSDCIIKSIYVYILFIIIAPFAQHLPDFDLASFKQKIFMQFKQISDITKCKTSRCGGVLWDCILMYCQNSSSRFFSGKFRFDTLHSLHMRGKRVY